MPTEAEIWGALTEIFRDVFDRDDLELKPELTAKDVAGWDSLKQIEIVMAAEDRFGITFNTRELDGFRDIGDLAAAIGRRSA